jgi:hypothetical protein
VNPLVFWNELAEVPVAKDRFAALARMNSFVDGLAALRRVLPNSPGPRLRASTPLDEVELAEG